MTTENWIAIAAIAATLLAPFIKVLLEKKLFREASELDKKKHKEKKAWLSWWRIVDWMLFLVPAAALVYELLSSEPLTRTSVFAISLSVASLLFMAMLQYSTNLSIKILEALAQSVVLHAKQLELSKKLVKTYAQGQTVKKRRLTSASTGRRR